ncbi:MAG: AbrB family transcriptional regulator [Patescibacteria group bacterium]
MADLLLRTIMGKDGRIVIPAKARRLFGLEPKAALTVRVSSRRLVLEKPLDRWEKLQKELAHMSYPKTGRMISEELIAERRAEAKREGI